VASGEKHTKETDPYQPDGPGWYPDPWSATGTGERYFDGKRWGTSERPRARHTVDPGPRAKPTIKARMPRFRTVAIFAVIGALAIALWLVQGSSRNSSEPAAAFAHPPAGTEEAARRLEPVAPRVTGTGQYEFIQHQPGAPNTPVAFDPCRPVHYVINPDGAPTDGVATVQGAFTRLQEATGLRFVSDGVTTEVPTRDRAPYQPQRYDGSRWAPILVAWSDETRFPALAGYVSGVSSPAPVTLSDGRSVYVTGTVVLDEDALADAALPDRALARAVILHELGHAVGLGHTSDRSQLMFSEAQLNVVDYGAGDLRGLALEGSGECFPEV
jgi:hypothetical protein